MKINKSEGHRALGSVYQQEEKFSEAEKEYEAAYIENPGNANLCLHTGIFLSASEQV